MTKCSNTKEPTLFPNSSKIGITSGYFEGLNVNHLLFLQTAKSMCDYLIVALDVRPRYESTFSRYKRLMSCLYVDKVIPFDTEPDLELILDNTSYDFRFVSNKDRKDLFFGMEVKPEKNIFLGSKELFL
jgi:glycerol-3-phosphate cytidylyltransferase